MRSNLFLFMGILALAGGCGDDDGGLAMSADAGIDASAMPPADGGEPEADAGETAPDSGSDAGLAPACDPHDVPCQEASFENLGLLETPSGDVITEEGATAGEFLTHVDATGAPATGTAPTTAYVYARFTDEGLEQVAIDDDAAFTSTEWDIALRRYIIRLNSGVSGPSCVRGARLPDGDDGEPPAFEDVTTLPEGLALEEESYFEGDACTFVDDGSGLPGAPASILASYWEYAGCLAMTGAVFVIELRDGRHVKLQVASYYPPDTQAQCDTEGSTPIPSGAANFRLRWAFLD